MKNFVSTTIAVFLGVFGALAVHSYVAVQLMPTPRYDAATNTLNLTPEEAEIAQRRRRDSPLGRELLHDCRTVARIAEETSAPHIATQAVSLCDRYDTYVITGEVLP